MTGNPGKIPDSTTVSFFMPKKLLGSAGENRVGRVSGNTAFFFLGLTSGEIVVNNIVSKVNARLSFLYRVSLC